MASASNKKYFSLLAVLSTYGKAKVQYRPIIIFEFLSFGDALKYYEILSEWGKSGLRPYRYIYLQLHTVTIPTYLGIL